MIKLKNIKIAAAPIMWSNDDMPEIGADIPVEMALSEAALLGYEGMEIGGKFPKEVAALKKLTQPRGIAIISGWFSSYLINKPYEETAALFVKHRDFLKAFDAKVIVVSEQSKSIQGMRNKAIFADKPYFDDGEWNRLADGLNRLGQLAQEQGMFLAYHPHMGTGVQTARETDKLLELTDPNLVFLTFDSGHFAYSGENPGELITRYIERVKHIHLKDIRQRVITHVKQNNLSFLDGVLEGTFTVPGDGDIDFIPIFSALKKAKWSGWMMVEAEQDPKKANPFEYGHKARAFIKKETGL